MEALPLSGLLVLELQAIGPVPFAGMVLAALGAAVTRILPPSAPERVGALNPRVDLLNRDKATMHLDLKKAEDRAALHEALVQADVLLEGWRPGVLERLGLAPGGLLERYPRLVIGRLCGWGTRGELAPRAGHDINYLAMSGVLAAIGPKSRPVPPLNLIADFGGGAMHLVAGVLARLVRRGITGKGGVAHTSILGGTIGLTPLLCGMLASGLWRLERESNLLDGGPPFYGVYPTSDGRFIALGALEPRFYRELLGVLDLVNDLDPAQQYDESTWPHVRARFAERIAQRGRDDWERVAREHDCCLSPVLDLAEAANHPHNQANEFFRGGTCVQPGTTIDFLEADASEDP